METRILETAWIPRIEEFYAEHGIGLREIRASWAVPLNRAGRLHFIGLLELGELVAVAWVAEKEHNILLRRRGDLLELVDHGPFVDSGGWLFRRDRKRRGLFAALAAAVITHWFEDIDRDAHRPLWGRVMGVPGESGAPRFWELVGERVTGLRFNALWGLPFGEAEDRILERWPEGQVPVTGQFAAEWHTIAHTPHPELARVEQKLRAEFGNRPLRTRYTVQSLAKPLRTTVRTARNDMGDLRTNLERALRASST